MCGIYVTREAAPRCLLTIRPIRGIVVPSILKEGYFMKKILAVLLAVLLLAVTPAAVLAETVDDEPAAGDEASDLTAGLSDIASQLLDTFAGLLGGEGDGETDASGIVSGLTGIVSQLFEAFTGLLGDAGDGEASEDEASDAASGLLSYVQSLIGMLAEYAGSEDVAADASAAFETVSQLLIKLYEAIGAVPEVSPEDLEEISEIIGDDDTELPEGELPLVDLANALSEYVFVQLDDPDALAELIADGTVYKYQVIEDGKGTVYIRVNIADHPEILNLAVFGALVDKLYAGEEETMLENGDESKDYWMTYQHIAGELALHVLVWAAANEVIRLTGTSNETVLSLYRAAVIADLDYAENRIPPVMLELFGVALVVTLRLMVMRLSF